MSPVGNHISHIFSNKTDKCIYCGCKVNSPEAGDRCERAPRDPRNYAKGHDDAVRQSWANFQHDATLSSAKNVVHQAFLRGGNAADNYAEMGVEDLQHGFGLSREDAQKLYDYIRQHP